MKLISWNVKGLEPQWEKVYGLLQLAGSRYFRIQETKDAGLGQLDLEMPGYHQYWNYAEKKGYSGARCVYKTEPISISYGIGVEEHDLRGRVITHSLMTSTL